MSTVSTALPLEAQCTHRAPLRPESRRRMTVALEIAGERWAIEIKLTASPTVQDLARLNKTADWIQADRRVLVTQTPRSSGTGRQASCDLPWLLERLPRWVGSMTTRRR